MKILNYRQDFWLRRQSQIPYKLTDQGIEITNGKKIFNRFLFGRNTSKFAFAGDKPIISPVDFKKRFGTLFLGIVFDGRGKWFHEFDSIKSIYRPHMMSYVLEDAIIKESKVYLDVLAL